MAKKKRRKREENQEKEPRRVPVQGRSKATFDAIVGAATHILREQGVAVVSTNKVAEHAGVSIGSVYQYFPNKDAILLAIAIAVHERFQSALLNALSNVAKMSLEESLEIVLTEVVRWRASDPKLLTAVDAYLPTVTEQAEVVNFLDRSSTAMIEMFLRTRANELAITDYPAAAFLLVHTIQPLAQRLYILGQREPERVVRVRGELQRMISGYLRTAASDAVAVPKIEP